MRDIPHAPYREQWRECCLERTKCCSTVAARSMLCAKITSKSHACNTLLVSIGTSLSRSLADIVDGAGNLLGYPQADLWVDHCCPLKLADHSNVTEEGFVLCTVGTVVPSQLLATSGDPAHPSPHTTSNSLALNWHNTLLYRVLALLWTTF